MKTTAIIAEYNPFHNGHRYQIEQARKITGCDRIIVIMSGDFVQRGGPAFMDKYSRCRMALEGGADMVIELPCAGASSSANIFARSAVSILDSMGCIDSLCFGCEDTDISTFEVIARILNNEPDEYRSLLRKHLERGAGFPLARMRALEEYLRVNGNTDYDAASILNILRKPNNILALEYIRALESISSDIKPVPIKRTGALHDSDSRGVFASARAIRSSALAGDISSIRRSVPDTSFSIILENSGAFLRADDFTQILSYSLLLNQGRLNEYCDVNDDLANRIENSCEVRTDIDEYINGIVSKNVTRSRIRRALFHIVLGHKKEMLETWKNESFSGYFRVLGFRKSSGDIFSHISRDAAKGMMIRTSDIKKLSGTSAQICRNDIFASRLYRSVLCSRYGIKKIPVLAEPVLIIS